MKNKFKISFAGIILVILVGWLYYAPYLAVNSLRTAAANNDAQAVSKLLDFPSLRESCKTWVKANLIAQMAEDLKDNPFAGLGLVLANAMIDPMVDAMISPSGMAAMLNARIPNPEKDVEPKDEAKGHHDSNKDNNVIVREGYTSFNEFELSAKERNEKNEIALIFHRSGLSWKLAEIRLPPVPITKADDAQAIPELSQRVTDLTGTLSASSVRQLDRKLADLEAHKGSQICVLIIPSLEGEDITVYGIRVAEKWKVGRKGVNDGAILIVAKNDHKLRLLVGNGLESVISDETAKRIIDGTIVPKFRKGDFAGGINAGIDQMIQLINGKRA